MKCQICDKKASVSCQVCGAVYTIREDQMEAEKKEYLQALVDSVRKDFIEPRMEIIEGEKTWPLEILDLELLCTVVEEDVLKEENSE